MVHPRVNHVYTMDIIEIYIYMVYTRHIPGIYWKLGFQMWQGSRLRLHWQAAVLYWLQIPVRVAFLQGNAARGPEPRTGARGPGGSTAHVGPGAGAPAA
jgi:hypothetical protein